ncbi:MAG TPA: dethiobiotin synthase [Phycisphaerae bacterium]|nr:dethiobiotin synthase [Phycisphaerae bacterium]
MIGGWFITGTDTGVGKTVIACALATLARQQGRKVGVFKPVATGCRLDLRLGWVSEDSEVLAHCAESTEDLPTICPARYAGDLAPMVAAEQSKRPIDWDAIDHSWRRIRDSNEWVIVEGAGGLLVPVDQRTNMADLARRFALPLVIVARPTLGTINHTLLTIEAARSRGLPIAVVVINGYRPGSATLAEETNPEVISRLAKTSIPLIVPFDPHTDLRQGIIGESVLWPLRQFVSVSLDRISPR